MSLDRWSRHCEDIGNGTVDELRLRSLPAHFATPTCEADALARRESIEAESRERDARIAARTIELRAANRAACTYRHDRSIARAAAAFNMALAVAKRDGFDVPHKDEINELMSRTIVGVRSQQSQTMEGDA